MNLNSQKPSERIAILATLPPASSTLARTSDFVPMDGFHKGLVKVLIGANTATGTLTLLRGDSTGGNTAAIATQAYGGAGTVGNDQTYEFNVDPHDLTDTADHFAVSVGAAGTVLSAAILEALDARYGPASDSNDSAVTVSR